MLRDLKNQDQSLLLDSLIELKLEIDRVLLANYRLDLHQSETVIGLIKILADSESIVLTQTQIAQRLCISESTLCTLIEKHRSDGLLIRERLITDRRKTRIGLTDKGFELLQEISNVEKKLDTRLAEFLSNETDFDLTLKTVQKLTKAVQNCHLETDTIRRAA